MHDDPVLVAIKVTIGILFFPVIGLTLLWLAVATVASAVRFGRPPEPRLPPGRTPPRDDDWSGLGPEDPIRSTQAKARQASPESLSEDTTWNRRRRGPLQ